jgi:hypothetical protein
MAQIRLSWQAEAPILPLGKPKQLKYFELLLFLGADSCLPKA